MIQGRLQYSLNMRRTQAVSIATLRRQFAQLLLAGVIAALPCAGRSQTLPTEIRLLVIDERSAAADARRLRMKARLEEVLRRPFVLEPIVATDITSFSSVAAALARVRDDPGVYVLAGSTLMATAAVARFEQATVVFASQHDPVEVGLVVRGGRRLRTTGFTYDVNVVPHVVSIAERSSFGSRTIAIVADRYLATAWHARIAAMKLRYPEHRFVLFEVNDGQALEACFSAAESSTVDVWVFLGTVALDSLFDRVKAHIEKQRKVAVYPGAFYVRAGGLMSYEPLFPDPYGVWARQIALLANGAAIGEVPVEHASHFRLAINLDAAKRIGRRWRPEVIKSASEIVSGR